MADSKRPNVLLIVADDLGFSDVGAFGGEIETPNLDQIAAEGLRTDHHVAGIGSMAERMNSEIEGKPGYEGYLNDAVVALPEVLRDAGYETLMAGKWHLGLTPDRTPHARGFDRSFSLLNGCHNHYGWEPAFEDRNKIPRMAAVVRKMYDRDGEVVLPKDLPKGFYSTDSFTDELLGYMKDREARKEERPFFAYLPFSAPHWPLQAPLDVVNKYDGKYDDGPEALRQKRLAALKKLGLVPKHAVPAPVISVDENGDDTKTWDELTPEERTISARKMAAYAGMVDRIDWNVGRIVEFLKKTDQYDNTVVIFMSDNGAEGAQFEAWPITAGGDMEAHVAQYHDNSVANIGAFNSFAWYGARWASASTAPGLPFKMFTSEGGIRVPFILRYPTLVKGGTIDHSFSTCMDIMPTLLDLCQARHPEAEYKGRSIVPMAGRTWLPFLSGKESRIHGDDHVIGWELFGRRAIRQGGFKALYIPKPFGPEKWQLFNILEDPGETNDLAEAQPEKMAAMIELYADYCQQNGVINQSGNSRNQWSDKL